MGENTGIEWTDATWNPWMGCTKVSPGCQHCYMYRQQTHYGEDPSMVRRSKTTFFSPLKWKEPKKVFTCSWSDFFIKEADYWRDKAWEVIGKTPHLTYQILTKRPLNVKDRLPQDWGSGWPNVWLGVSVENAEYLDRVETLMGIPAAVKFISYEPALGPVDFSPYLKGIDWMISGGESVSSRGVDLDWFRAVRNACLTNQVPYFHKQNGGSKKIDGVYGGKILDGEIWQQFPAEKEVLA